MQEQSASRSLTPPPPPERRDSRTVATPPRQRSRSPADFRRSSISPPRGGSFSPRRSSRSPRRSSSPTEEEIYNKGNTLYVSGLSSRTRESELEHKFSKYGNVVSCRLVYDRRTMESRGYGFISMEAVQQADEVIHYLNNTELNGRIVTVEKALRARPRTPTPGRYLGKDRATRERYYGFSGYSGGGGGGGGYGGPRGYPPRGGYYDYGPGPTGPHRNYYDYGHRYSPYYRRGSPHYSRRYSRSPPRARSPHARATRPSPPAAPAAARRSP